LEDPILARPEVTGKKITAAGIAPDRDAYGIEEFCQRHSISVPQYYKMRKLGLTPREFRIGTRVLISKESAAAWRREREVAAETAANVSRKTARKPDEAIA
jgi:hypothetical protein